MISRHRTLLMATVLAVALAPAATAAAQQRIDETRTASPDMSLEIDDLIVGSITVTGWDRNEMHVTGTIGEDVNNFEIEGGPDRFEIYADWDEGHDWDGHDWGGQREDEDGREGHRERRGNDDLDIDLEIRVPFGASLELNGVTASIRVMGVNGEIELETVTGDIEYEGEARVLDLVTVTGRISAKTATLSEGSFETVQGSIDFEGALAQGADVNFESVMGRITLVLPGDVSAEFDVETMMGDIDNELGPAAISEGRWVPSKELSFSTGDGSADVSIETLQGDIRILRR